MNKPSLKSALRTGGSVIYEFVSSMFRSDKQCDSAINEILFYGAEDEERTKQKVLNNMICICYVIHNASRTVDVCVPGLVSNTLAKCLVKVHQKNKVYVRIAIHNSKNYQNLTLFSENEIEVKIITPSVKLEHEFVLVDAGARDSVAVLGALEHAPGCRGLRSDATLLTSESAVLTSLSREFERVWNSPGLAVPFLYDYYDYDYHCH